MSSVSSVARISFLSSAVVVNVTPGDADSSLFGATYSSLAASNSESKPLLKSIPRTADIERALDIPTTLTTLTLSSPSRSSIARLLVTLPPLANTPLVVNLAVEAQNLSGVLDLRSSVPYVLLSGTRQQAHDNALLAARLSYTEKKAVLHIFLSNSSAAIAFGDVPETSIRTFLNAPKRAGATANGNARPNGLTANGNGHAIPNGVANGHAKPNGLSHSRTDSISKDLDDSPESDLYRGYSAAALSTLALVRRAIRPSVYAGPTEPDSVVVTLGQLFTNPCYVSVNLSLYSVVPSTSIARHNIHRGYNIITLPASSCQ